jgi:hypothetical protein
MKAGASLDAERRPSDGAERATSARGVRQGGARHARTPSSRSRPLTVAGPFYVPAGESQREVATTHTTGPAEAAMSLHETRTRERVEANTERRSTGAQVSSCDSQDCWTHLLAGVSLVHLRCKKVANRIVRVWPGRWSLNDGQRHTCTCEYGLQSWRGKSLYGGWLRSG